MGWTTCSNWKSKGEVVAAVLSECYGPCKVLATASTRSGLWVVSERPDGTKDLDLHLISKEGGDYGYKSISESMGPYECDCPLNLLAMVPGGNVDFRARVRAFHASKAATYSPGDAVTVSGRPFTVVGPRTTRTGRAGGFLVRDETGKVYRTTAKNMRLTADVEAEEKAEREAALASPYMVTAAWGDWCKSVPEGMVGVCATPGGNRKGYGTEKYVLLPSGAYDVHKPLTGSETPWGGPNFSIGPMVLHGSAAN